MCAYLGFNAQLWMADQDEKISVKTVNRAKG